MKTLSNETQFSLHYVIASEPLTRSDLPEELDSFVYDDVTKEPLTISIRCDKDEWFSKMLILSYKDSGAIEPIQKNTTKGIFSKTGGIELISEYMLSNFITDWEDPEHTHINWVDSSGNEIDLDINANLVVNGKSEDFRPPSIWDEVDEFVFKNQTYKKRYINNLSLASDFRNLIVKRKYPNEDEYGYKFDLDGEKRFQYNINQVNLKEWIDEYRIPDFIFDILEKDQKNQLANRLASHIQWNWQNILKNIFNQKFIVEEVKDPQKSFKDTWGTEMYSSLGGDGDESIYLSDGVSLRPDGSISDN